MKNYYVAIWYLLNGTPGRMGVLEDISFPEINNCNIKDFKKHISDRAKNEYPDILHVTVISWQEVREV